jgi:hypothetical protein
LYQVIYLDFNQLTIQLTIQFYFEILRNCNFLTIELLIKYGANLKLRDIHNRNILHWCAFTGKVILFHYFKEHHSIVNINDVDKFQQNSLHIACASGFHDLIIYLMKSREIDLFAQDLNGNTCLHMAVKSGLGRICWLLVRGTNKTTDNSRLVTIINKQKQRPFDMIRNEKGPNFRIIREWLQLEEESNSLTQKNNIFVDLIEEEKIKKSTILPLVVSKGVHKLEKTFKTLINWNSNRKMQAEWSLRLLTFFCAVFLPTLLDIIILGVGDLRSNTLWKGIFGYSTYGLIVAVATKQKHRISHISG